ncbi:MAG: hypothetical protein NT015_05690 [Alphaproteobacteria bacterium]|nr:hypothetical protein [Alphaproteobacteria bacterium]
MDEGEVQILKSAALSVTDRRIITPSAEIAVTPALAPQLEAKTVQVPVRTTFIALGCVLLLLGFLMPLYWIISAALFGAAAVVKVKRKGFEVSVAQGGERTPIYMTASEKDAQLALAAVNEALRRAAA